MKLTSLQIGIFVLRVALGTVFLAHALLKPLVLTWEAARAFFVHHGFPGWTMYAVFGIELLGGVSLLLGMGTRWAAVALIPVTVGALRVYANNGWVFSRPGGGWEYVAFLTASLLALSLMGSGAWALDDAMAHWRRRARSSSQPKRGEVSRFTGRQHRPPR